MLKKSVIVAAILAASTVLEGCPEEKMLKYYVSGYAVGDDGDAVDDIVVTMDLCEDGKVDAKIVTYAGGRFNTVFSSWEDCDTLELTFEDWICDREGGSFPVHSEILQLKKIGDRYDYMSEEGYTVTLTKDQQ